MSNAWDISGEAGKYSWRTARYFEVNKQLPQVAYPMALASAQGRRDRAVGPYYDI